MSTRLRLNPTLMGNSGSQSLGSYLYCLTTAFSRFCLTYSSGDHGVHVSLSTFCQVAPTSLGGHSRESL